MGVAGEIATSQAVWAVLCIILAGYVLMALRKDSIKRENDIIALYESQKAEAKINFDLYRTETKEREAILMTHLERSNQSQENTTGALESINRTMVILEGRIDSFEKNINYRGERG